MNQNLLSRSKSSSGRLILPFVNDGLSHSIDLFTTLVVWLFKVNAFANFSPALRNLTFFYLVD